MAKRYGIPYRGSKNKIIAQIFELFPTASNFYDLFAGGCAATHYALENKNYKNIICNDINPMPIQLFRAAVDGKLAEETRWIDRATFEKLKKTDPYIAYCWSFGNNGRSYLYGEEIEPWKKALHNCIFNNDCNSIKIFLPNIDFDFMQNITGIENRRLTLQTFLAEKLNIQLDANPNSGYALFGARLQNVERLEQLQSLQNLQALQSLQSAQWHSVDYAEIDIKPNSIIYCDIPYQNTESYGLKFNYKRFYNWCAKQTEPLFISSYSMPANHFACIKQIKHAQTIGGGQTPVIERVFMPIHQAANYQLPGCLFNFGEL